nr:ribonuclease H-like domain-containing protein [Tanacetum cinerariifolium]
MRPFGCPVTILNTIDHLGKFNGKANEGFFVRYSLNSKAFRVFNSRTRIVEENLHIRFSENIPNVVGSGLDWLFDIDAPTRKMNYEPIVAGTQSNGFADPKSSHDDGSKPLSDNGKMVDEDLRKENECNDQGKKDNVNSTNNFWSTIMAKTINVEVQIHARVDGKKIVITKSSVRRDLQLADEEDEAVHKELGDRLVRTATTASSLEAEQDKRIEDTTAETRFESVSKHSNDSLLTRGNTLRSVEDSLKLNELMELCTNLQNRVLDLEKIKTSQRNEIDSLKRRFKKLEQRNRSRTHKLKRLYKVSLTARVESSGDEESFGEDASKQRRRIDVIDANDEITLVNDDDNEMFNVDDLGGEEVFVA